ncbi:MAG: protein serine/threonine phosphatase [Bacteroidota bacterium]|jgi:tetratricopeptide (TPR) repeat protein|nr:protein serine/threonine phosphatase [Bacteroidota bacterium]
MKKLILLLIILNLFQHNTLAQNPITDSLLKLLKTNKQDTFRINILNDISKEYRNTGDYEFAISYSKQAETLATKLNFKKGLAKALNASGVIYEIQGSYPKALDYYLRSLKIREEIGDKKGIANSLNNIGIIYYYQRDYPKALNNYSRSLKIREEIKDENGIATCLNNIGIIYKNQGEHAKALEHYFRALKIRETIDDKKGIASCVNNIGNIYFEQGHYPKALEYYLHSLKINEEIGDKNGLASSYINLGDTYLKIGNETLAIEYEIKALSLANEIEALDLIKTANEFLSNAYAKTNQHQKAFEHYKAFINARDSLFNEKNTKKLLQSELKFDYEKKEQASKLEQEKKDALALEEQKKQKVIRNSFMGGFVLLFVLSIVIFRSYRNKKIANELISLQKNTIEEKQKHILDSIHYAKRIQEALLKEEQHVSNHLPEHFVLFKPKDIISGDFYWALEKQGHLYLAAADCTGHGVPGAMMSMLGIAFLNEINGTNELLSPAEILNRLRDKVVKELGSSGQTKDGMDISLCKINLETRALEWAGANNPLWSIQSSSSPGGFGNKELKEIKADKQPIGYTDVYKPFTNHTFIEKNCTYYLFTDGYADQFGGPKGKKFKYKSMQEKLINLYDKPLETQKNELATIFDEWKGNLEQVDDVCVIGIRI